MKRDESIMVEILRQLEDCEYGYISIETMLSALTGDFISTRFHIRLLQDQGLLYTLGDNEEYVRLTDQGHDYLESMDGEENG